jgi:hypothetical protein
MIILESEYNSLISRLQERTREIDSNYDDRNTILGNIGEKFVGYCICHSLWKLGYELSYQYPPCSYKIIPRYGANEDGIGGIDFHLEITNSNECRYCFLIEAKNWSHYVITPDMFNSQILNRFTRVDNDRQCTWMITMNRRNIESIHTRCQENNIHIIPITEHITPPYVENESTIKMVIAEFINSFCTLITELASQSSYPYLKVERTDNKPKWNMIFQDLLMGVPYSVIESRYDTTRSYISRCSSELRRWIRDLPDRRNRDWRLLWEIQE